MFVTRDKKPPDDIPPPPGPPCGDKDKCLPPPGDGDNLGNCGEPPSQPLPDKEGEDLRSSQPPQQDGQSDPKDLPVTGEAVGLGRPGDTQATDATQGKIENCS